MKKMIAFFLTLILMCSAVALADSADVSVGDIIIFGRYEQDNHSDNGPEPIEWIVLDIQDGKALLLSKYGLEARPFHKKSGTHTWEKSSLRAWLNNDFLNAAFNENEQASVLPSIVDNSDDREYICTASSGGFSMGRFTPGNNTDDRVFLLSWDEAFNLYLPGNDDRKCPLTDYAIAGGAWSNSENAVDGHDTGRWWLRSIDEDGMYAGMVDYNGSFFMLPYLHDQLVVRPAIWLDLNSEII